MKRRDRHHHRSRKHDDEDRDEEDGHDSRAVGSLSRRSSHRHRDDDKEKDSGRSSHRSHRSHRDRSKERDRPSRKRSRSPEDELHRSNHVNGVIQTNGASHVNGVPPTGPKADRERKREKELTHSGSKRREREEDDDYQGDRKRSKPDHSESFETMDDHRSTKRVHREDTVKSFHKASQANQEVAPEKPQPPLTPKSASNPHALEREARNRERMQKEMQRRSAADTKSSDPKRKMSAVGSGGRRVSYKYEDEESSEARTSRVESEREASRWG